MTKITACCLKWINSHSVVFVGCTAMWTQLTSLGLSNFTTIPPPAGHFAVCMYLCMYVKCNFLQLGSIQLSYIESQYKSSQGTLHFKVRSKSYTLRKHASMCVMWVVVLVRCCFQKRSACSENCIWKQNMCKSFIASRCFYSSWTHFVSSWQKKQRRKKKRRKRSIAYDQGHNEQCPLDSSIWLRTCARPMFILNIDFYILCINTFPFVKDLRTV